MVCTHCRGKGGSGKSAVSSSNLETKGVNWNLLAQKVNGEGGSNKKGVGKILKKLDLAEILFGMLKVFLLPASPHTISLRIFSFPSLIPLYSASVWV